MMLDILYWSDYMQDKIILDTEFLSVQAVSDGTLDVSDLMRGDFDVDLFFKKLRVQILYFEKRLCPHETQDVNGSIWLSTEVKGFCALSKNSAWFLPYSNSISRK
ncbi:hypothetical protein [uncultured Selenomonas sp.]|jgi:hypothetical protein|uniref:hypothetical protein n=1 Tax=uncultured Selenomonas sp. TaxID=159275 RepID=UPI0028F13899|nr:hypothetical protein [uncultured Selenomonas sp.]